MKKITALKPFVFLLGLLFILASCSKEAKFEKRLDGNWNMSLAGQSYEDGVATDSYNWPNIGTVSFERDGTGSMTILGQTESFTWTANETHITISDVGQMEIIKNEKNEQVWEMEETEVDNNVTYREVTTMTLKKQ